MFRHQSAMLMGHLSGTTSRPRKRLVSRSLPLLVCTLSLAKAHRLLSRSPNATLINGLGRFPDGPEVDLAVINVQQGKR